jgi:hypothetical protein
VPQRGAAQEGGADLKIEETDQVGSAEQRHVELLAAICATQMTAEEARRTSEAAEWGLEVAREIIRQSREKKAP